jgi:hypothetical protein
LVEQAGQPDAFVMDDGQKPIGARAINLRAFKQDFGE